MQVCDIMATDEWTVIGGKGKPRKQKAANHSTMHSSNTPANDPLSTAPSNAVAGTEALPGWGGSASTSSTNNNSRQRYKRRGPRTEQQRLEDMVQLLMDMKQEVAQTSMYQALQRAMAIAAEALSELQWTPAAVAGGGGSLLADADGMPVESAPEQLTDPPHDLPLDTTTATSPTAAEPVTSLPTAPGKFAVGVCTADGADSLSHSSSSPWCVVQQLVVYGLGCIEDSRVSRYQVGGCTGP